LAAGGATHYVGCHRYVCGAHGRYYHTYSIIIIADVK